ncbi:MAG: hypothetical protein AAGE94_22345 [Acidobacteriota bacterium]
MKLVTMLLALCFLIAPAGLADATAETLPSCDVQPLADGLWAQPAFQAIAPVSCIDECDAERFACFAGCSDFVCYDACLAAFNACIIRC